MSSRYSRNRMPRSSRPSVMSRTRRRSGAWPVHSRIKSMSSAFSDLGLSSSSTPVEMGEGVGERGVDAEGGDDDEVFSSSLLLTMVVTFRSPPGDISVTTPFEAGGRSLVSVVDTASTKAGCHKKTYAVLV